MDALQTKSFFLLVEVEPARKISEEVEGNSGPTTKILFWVASLKIM